MNILVLIPFVKRSWGGGQFANGGVICSQSSKSFQGQAAAKLHDQKVEFEDPKSPRRPIGEQFVDEAMETI